MFISFERAIVLRSDLSELARLNELFAELAKEQHVSKDQILAAKLCAHEAIANIINYAFEDAREHRIDIVVRLTTREISLEISDEGCPFDPLNTSYPVRREAADANVGGQGIHLIRNFSDHLHYERVDGRNRLTISVVRENRPDENRRSG